jgi:hypothetical protein
MISSSSGPISFRCDREYPDFDLELETDAASSSSDARVSVVPAGIKTLAFIARDTLKCLCSVDIILRYRFGFDYRERETGGTEVHSIDDFVNQTEQFFLYLCAHRRIGDSVAFDACLEEVEIRTMTDPKHIRQKQFTSQLRAHYQVTKTITQAG